MAVEMAVAVITTVAPINGPAMMVSVFLTTGSAINSKIVMMDRTIQRDLNVSMAAMVEMVVMAVLTMVALTTSLPVQTGLDASPSGLSVKTQPLQTVMTGLMMLRPDVIGRPLSRSIRLRPNRVLKVGPPAFGAQLDALLAAKVSERLTQMRH